MEIRNIITFVRIAELQIFPKLPDSWVFPVGGDDADQTAGGGTARPTVRPHRQAHQADPGGAEAASPRAGNSGRGAQGPEHYPGAGGGFGQAAHRNGRVPFNQRASARHHRIQLPLSPRGGQHPDRFGGGSIRHGAAQRNRSAVLFGPEDQFPRVDQGSGAPGAGRLCGLRTVPPGGTAADFTGTAVGGAFLLTEKGISYRYAMEQVLAESGMEIHPFLETGNTDIITKMLLENRGISFLPEFVVRDYIQDGRLAVLDTVCPEICMWSQLVYHKNKYLTPQMERFTELMVRQIGSGPLA